MSSIQLTGPRLPSYDNRAAAVGLPMSLRPLEQIDVGPSHKDPTFGAGKKKLEPPTSCLAAIIATVGAMQVDNFPWSSTHRHSLHLTIQGLQGFGCWLPT